MSYQLIYTTHGKVANAADSVTRVVARTQTMPAQMVQTLVDRGALLRPADAGDALFLYSAVEYGGEKYHLLGSVRENRQQGVTTVHYLLLREDECRRMAQEDAHATPAGILLLLELQRFWVISWEEEPVQLEEQEARLAGECPAAESCATWQVLTGDRENARLLLKPPYNAQCLLSVPVGTKARDALRLLHESDMLSEARGWGAGLCVNAGEERLLGLFQRVVCVAQSPLVQQAQQQQMPVLCVRPGLMDEPSEARIGGEISSRSPVPAGVSMSVKLAEKTPQTPIVPSDSPLSRIPLMLPCHYAESAPEGFFEKPVEERRERGRWRVAAIVGVSVGVLLAAALLPGLLQKKDPPQSEEHALRVPESPSDPPSRNKEERQTEISGGGYAMSEQTDEARPKKADAGDYKPGVVEQPHLSSVSESARTMGLEIGAEDQEATNSAEEAMEGSRKVIVAGRTLPKELLPEEVSVADRGECILHFKTSEDQKERRVIPLQPGDTVLEVRRMSDHSVSVSVLRGGKPMDDLPVFTITEKNNRLERITAHGKAAAVQLPYFDEQGGVSHAVLLPELRVRVRPAGYCTPPVAADDLDLRNLSQLYDPHNEARVVNLSEIKLLSTQRSELTPAGSLRLPDFGLQNEVRIASADASCSVRVRPAESAAPGMTDFSWTITRKFDFRKYVALYLRKFAFEPPKSDREKSRYCFNDLYGLVSQLSEEKNANRRDDKLDQYFEMFRDEAFAQYAREHWMRDCLQLTPAGRALSGELRRMLLRPENIRKIRQSLLQCVDAQVRRAYSMQRNQYLRHMPIFTLSLSEVKLSSQNKLIWSFTLRIGN